MLTNLLTQTNPTAANKTANTTNTTITVGPGLFDFVFWFLCLHLPVTVQFTTTLGVTALAVEDGTNSDDVDTVADELVATISDDITDFDIDDTFIDSGIADAAIEFDIADIVDTVTDFDVDDIFALLNFIEEELVMFVLSDDKLLSISIDKEVNKTVYEGKRDKDVGEGKEELAVSKTDVGIIFAVSVFDGWICIDVTPVLKEWFTFEEELTSIGTVAFDGVGFGVGFGVGGFCVPVVVVPSWPQYVSEIENDSNQNQKAPKIALVLKG